MMQPTTSPTLEEMMLLLRSYRQQLELQSYNRVTLVTKLVMCWSLGYQLVRFVNNTGRKVPLMTADCGGTTHEVTHLPPGTNVLLLVPPAHKVWPVLSAPHKCTHTYNGLMLEHIFNITLCVSSLKDMSMMYIGERLRQYPHRVDELNLPHALQKQLIGHMIPMPEDPLVDYKPHTCLFCNVKLPKMLYFNPLLHGDHGEHADHVYNDLHNYISLTDILSLIFKTFGKNVNAPMLM